jgi:hypothetical protein
VRNIVTIAFASAIALSTIAPAFAYENDLEGPVPAPIMHPGKRTTQHRAFDARASMPTTMPTTAPPAAPAGAYWDFGIGSQS